MIRLEVVNDTGNDFCRLSFDITVFALTANLGITSSRVNICTLAQRILVTDAKLDRIIGACWLWLAGSIPQATDRLGGG